MTTTIFSNMGGCQATNDRIVDKKRHTPSILSQKNYNSF
jgi:hypothetical protein